MKSVAAITAPTGSEVLVMLAMAILFAGVVGGTIWLVVRLTRRDGTGSPAGQQPPPGYWWDGQKWNPPGERAE
jgi:hypothetical protein